MTCHFGSPFQRSREAWHDPYFAFNLLLVANRARQNKLASRFSFKRRAFLYGSHALHEYVIRGQAMHKRDDIQKWEYAIAQVSGADPFPACPGIDETLEKACFICFKNFPCA